jgi:hypothetical protein
VIDEKRLAALRERSAYLVPTFDRPVNSLFVEMADTLEALWRVARAAESIAKENSKVGWYEIPSRGSYLSDLFSALSALSQDGGKGDGK